MAENRPLDVAVAGHICLDIIPRFPDTGARTLSELLQPGKLVNVEEAAISTGGPVSNTGLALGLLGLRVEFVAKVGDDPFGELILRLLQRRARTEGVKRVSGVSTSYTVGIAPPNIDRLFLHCPGANNSFQSSDIDYSLVRRARVFHLGYPPLMRALYQNEGEQLAETFRLAKQAGATTSLDMSLPDPRSESGQAPWSRILEKTLPNVDIFLPSVEEALFMLRRERFLALKQQTGGAEAIDLLEPNDYRDLSSALLELGSSLIVLKSAHRGFYLRTAGGKRVAGIGPAAPAQPEEWASREVWCPAFHVGRIASATGSGDSSIAGFLAALLRGESLPRCLRFANAVGAQNLTELDAVSGIKGWEETVAQVNDRSLALNDLPLREGADGWQLDSQAQVWERQRGS